MRSSRIAEKVGLLVRILGYKSCRVTRCGGRPMRGWDVKSDALFSYVSCEGPRRSHARNPPTHRKSQQNRRKDLLDKQRSATQERVTFDDPTFRFANTEFFSVLLECRTATAYSIVPSRSPFASEHAPAGA